MNPQWIFSFKTNEQWIIMNPQWIFSFKTNEQRIIIIPQWIFSLTSTSNEFNESAMDMVVDMEILHFNEQPLFMLKNSL